MKLHVIGSSTAREVTDAIADYLLSLGSEVTCSEHDWEGLVGDGADLTSLRNLLQWELQAIDESQYLIVALDESPPPSLLSADKGKLDWVLSHFSIMSSSTFWQEVAGVDPYVMFITGIAIGMSTPIITMSDGGAPPYLGEMSLLHAKTFDAFKTLMVGLADIEDETEDEQRKALKKLRRSYPPSGFYSIIEKRQKDTMKSYMK